MTKKLHTRTKIFFKNPYVVRIEYDNLPMADAEVEYRKIWRRAYREIKGTWGYSKLEIEMKAPLEKVLIQNIFDGFWTIRGYVCFKEETDALQFRLSIDTTSRQVQIWPETWFTIHEFIETDVV